MLLVWPPQTGADVLFIMNYPAYVGEESADENYHVYHPGLGFKYSSDKVCILLGAYCNSMVKNIPSYKLL